MNAKGRRDKTFQNEPVKGQKKGKGGKQKGNLGVGTDLAFVWLNSDRISTFSVGAGVRDKIEDGNGKTVKKVEPVFQISYTLSFGL
jgi:hypothetical protein